LLPLVATGKMVSGAIGPVTKSSYLHSRQQREREGSGLGSECDSVPQSPAAGAVEKAHGIGDTRMRDRSRGGGAWHREARLASAAERRTAERVAAPGSAAEAAAAAPAAGPSVGAKLQRHRALIVCLAEALTAALAAARVLVRPAARLRGGCTPPPLHALDTHAMAVSPRLFSWPAAGRQRVR
jgi:hypothetical protein